MNITSIKKRLDKLKTSLDSTNNEVQELIIDIDFDNDGNTIAKYFVKFRASDTPQEITEQEYDKYDKQCNKDKDNIKVEFKDD